MSDPYREFLRVRARLAFYEKHFPVLGFDPMSPQRLFVETRAKISVFSGGNRSGKTSAGAYRAALLANGVLGRFHPESGAPSDGTPTRGWVSALDYRLSETVRRKLEHFLGSTVRRWYAAERMFVLHNGSEIWLKSEEAGEQKYQAEDVHWAWKDEAGPPTSEGVVNEVLRALTDHDGPLFITMTPTLGASWVGPRFYDRWLGDSSGEEGKVADGVTFVFSATEDNRFLSRSGLRSFVSQQVTEEQRAVRLHGRFVALEGLVFPGYRESRHVIDPIPIPDSWSCYRGMDFGLAAPSTCIFAAVEPPTPKEGCPCPPELRPHPFSRLHVYDEVYDERRGHTIAMTCEDVKAKSGKRSFTRTVLDPACWAKEAAPTSVGGYFLVAEEYERHGVFVERANHEFEPSVERLWTWLGSEGEQPRLVIHKNCVNLRLEMRGLRWKRVAGILLSAGPRGGMAERVDPVCPKHAIDGLRYVAMCNPLLGGYPMLGPDSDPEPYGDIDLLNGDLSDEQEDPYRVLYH